MKVLVTGGSGVFGSYLVQYLKNLTNWEVLAPSRLDVNICDKIDIYTNVDYIIHAAALRYGTPRNTVDVNIFGTMNILEFAESCGANLLYISSIDVIGPKDNEGLNPTTIYSSTKYAGEVLCQRSKVPVTILRPVNIYPDIRKFPQICKEHIIKREKITIFTGGRMYVHRDDVCNAIRLIIESGLTGIFNMTGERIENLDVAQIVSNQLKIPFEYELKEGGPGNEPEINIPSCERLLTLGWQLTHKFSSIHW